MSDNTPETTPATEEPQGGVPQAVADDIAVLAAEVRAVEAKASSAWKISVVIWIVLLAVIFSYLQFAVMNALVKPLLQPEQLAGLMKVNLDSLLTSQGLPSIDTAQFADAVAGKLRDAAPELMQGKVKPFVQDLVGRAPELRGRAVAYLRENSESMGNKALDMLEAEYMPQLDGYLQEYIATTADDLMDQVQDDFQDVIVELVTTVSETRGELEDDAAVQKALADAIEEGMGSHLDEMLEGLDDKVAMLRERLEQMIDRMKEGRLTERDKLEILLFQDIRMLFESREFDMQMQQSNPFDELRRALSGLQLPEATTTELVKEAQAGGPINYDQIADQAQRDAVRQAIENAKAGAAAAAAAQAGRGGPPAGQPGARGPGAGGRGPRAGGGRGGGAPTQEAVARSRAGLMEQSMRGAPAQEKPED